jgi:hypothetical protein
VQIRKQATGKMRNENEGVVWLIVAARFEVKYFSVSVFHSAT